MNYFNDFPVEIAKVIFERLDFISFLELRKVNKCFKSIIDKLEKFNLNITFKIENSHMDFKEIQTIGSLIKAHKNIDCITLTNVHFLRPEAIQKLNIKLQFYEKKLKIINYQGSTQKLCHLLNNLIISELSINNAILFNELERRRNFQHLYYKYKSKRFDVFHLKKIEFIDCDTEIIDDIILKNGSNWSVENIYIFKKGFVDFLYEINLGLLRCKMERQFNLIYLNKSTDEYVEIEYFQN